MASASPRNVPKPAIPRCGDKIRLVGACLECQLVHQTRVLILTAVHEDYRDSQPSVVRLLHPAKDVSADFIFLPLLVILWRKPKSAQSLPCLPQTDRRHIEGDDPQVLAGRCIVQREGARKSIRDTSTSIAKIENVDHLNARIGLKSTIQGAGQRLTLGRKHMNRRAVVVVTRRVALVIDLALRGV